MVLAASAAERDTEAGTTGAALPARRHMEVTEHSTSDSESVCNSTPEVPTVTSIGPDDIGAGVPAPVKEAPGQQQSNVQLLNLETISDKHARVRAGKLHS